MTGRAEIRVVGRSGMFVAESCRIDGPWVHVEGRWRVRLAAGIDWGASGCYTWPVAAVAEIRWQVA